MKPFLSFICWLFCFAAWAQTWTPLQRGVNREVRALYADTVTNSLYVGGSFSKTGYFSDTNGKWVMGIAQWDGMQWDTLSCGMDVGPNCVFPSNPAMFPNPVLAIAKYNSELYIGGSFAYAGSIPAWGIAKWNGNSWASIGNAESEAGSYASVVGLFTDGSDMYAVGNFTKIGGIHSPKIAKYNGINWVALPVLDSVEGWTIGSVVRYHGDLYVGGNFEGGIGMNDIARYNGTTWVSVGGGLSGAMTHVNKLYVWHDTLFVGGYFQKASGDPGNNIAAWDGNSWSDVGGGTMPANVADMIDFNGYLYVCGQIDNAGAIPVSRMARWDGARWCKPDVDFGLPGGGATGTPGCLAVLNNELYVAGGFNLINGDSLNNIAKYTGPSIVSSCDTITGLFELVTQNAISIYPSPSTNMITVEFGFVGTKGTLFEIKNILGETLKKIDDNRVVYGKNKIDIDISNFSTGVYFLQIKTEDKKLMNAKFVKE